MNAYFLSNLPSIAESKFISAINTRIISYVNGKMSIAQVQDSVIGGYLLTQDEIKMDQIFVSRMHRNGRLIIEQSKYADKEGITTGKDCLSLNFPNLSYKENTEFYNKELKGYIEYKASDQQLDIQLGRIKTGYFDKKANQYQKTIALTFNPTTALNTIFSIQQTILNFNMYTGLSVGFKELLYVNQKKINEMRENMISSGYEIMQQYNNNLFGSQIDKSAYEEFQDKLRNCFMNDGFEHIMEAAKITGNKVGNNLVNLALTGSKGSLQNIKNMIVQIGQINVDGEPLKPLFHSRINMFYKKNDINPLSKGIVMNSYLSGLTPSELLINATSERVQMLTKTLSVAKPGYLGRKLIKNTENIIIANNRLICKTNAIYQDLFGLDGFNVSSLSVFKIPMMYSTDQEFKNWFSNTLPEGLELKTKDYSSDQVSAMIQKHSEDVALIIKQTKIALSRCQFVNNQQDMKDYIQIPVTLNNIVETHIQQIIKDQGVKSIAELPEKVLNTENLIANVQIVRNYCAQLQYLYFNEKVAESKLNVPESYSNGVKNLKIALLCVFTFDKLALFTPKQMHYLLESVGLLTKEAMINPGSAIGVLVAQAFQEYFTQDLLDAIHKVKGQSTAVDPLDKIIDLFNNRTPQNLASLNKPQPTIKIPLRIKDGQSIEEQRQRAKEIANKIKVISLRTLLSKWEIIMSSIERETEQNFIEDREMLEKAVIPPEVSVWCFRVILDKNKMFLNNIVIDEIKTAIEQSYDMFVITHQGDDKDQIAIRMYLGPSIQFDSGLGLRNIMDEFLDFNLRGIRGILDTSVFKETIPVYDANKQQIVQKDRLVIYTEGYNLRDIMRQQLKYQDDIDFSSITCDNHTVILSFFGKSAAQQKIYNEIKGIFGTSVDPRHITFIASVMTQQGYLSILESDGIKKRNKDAPLISMTESRAVINLINACVQNQVSNLQSLSDNTMLGQINNQSGTNFNKLILNTNFIYDQNAQKRKETDVFDV